MDIAVEYAKDPQAVRQTDRAVSGRAASVRRYADVDRELAVGRRIIAAWALERRLPEARGAVSVAKTYASDACREVGNRGVQVQGGMGFTWENDMHLYLPARKGERNRVRRRDFSPRKNRAIW